MTGYFVIACGHGQDYYQIRWTVIERIGGNNRHQASSGSYFSQIFIQTGQPDFTSIVILPFHPRP